MPRPGGGDDRRLCTRLSDLHESDGGVFRQGVPDNVREVVKLITERAGAVARQANGEAFSAPKRPALLPKWSSRARRSAPRLASASRPPIELSSPPSIWDFWPTTKSADRSLSSSSCKRVSMRRTLHCFPIRSRSRRKAAPHDAHVQPAEVRGHFSCFRSFQTAVKRQATDNIDESASCFIVSRFSEECGP